MQDDSTFGPNPAGLCMCGCGGVTSLAIQNDPRNGILKGQHRRFLRGHQLRGKPRTEEVKRKLSEKNRGRRLGAAAMRWRGGVQMRHGRKHLLVSRDHPMATKSGYVAECRLIVAEKIGRNLRTEEHVHHIDLDPTNDHPDNLELLTRSEHMRVHRLIDRTGLSPLDALDVVLKVRAH